MRSLLEACSKMKDRMEGYQGGLFMDMWEGEVLSARIFHTVGFLYLGVSLNVVLG